MQLKNKQIIVETTNMCDAHCVICPREKYKEKRGVMDMKLFKKIIDDAAQYDLESTDTCGFGECFLDGYIFDRFGYQRTALLGAYNTFQHDAVIRELGKVFGIPPTDIDRLQKGDAMAAADEMGRLVLKYAKLIQGFPSHLSIHSSGIIISEAPIHSYSATNMPPKGFPTTQYSMLEAEDIGLYKFDILSQRGLGNKFIQAPIS